MWGCNAGNHFCKSLKKSISRSFKNWCFLNIFPKTYPLFWVRICKAIRNILKEPNILPPIFPQVSDFQDFYLKWVYFYSLVQIWHFEQEALLTDSSSWTCNNGKASPTPTRLLPKQRYWYKQYFFRFNKRHFSYSMAYQNKNKPCCPWND